MCFSSGKTQPGISTKTGIPQRPLRKKLKLASAAPSDSPQNFLSLLEDGRSASPTPTLPIRISIGEQRDRMEFFHHWHKTHIFCKHIHFAADWSQIRSVEQRWSDTFLSLSPNPCQPCRLIERRRRCKGGQIDRD